jgi:aminoglycoside N3'-acetyltransferase
MGTASSLTMNRLLSSGMTTVKTRVFYTAQRVLSQERRNNIKLWLASRRKEWAKLYVMIHGNYTAKELVADIKSHINRDFEILMVHSGYDRLLPMYTGKHQDILHELLEFCGKDRTLVFPTFVLGGRAVNPIDYFKTRNFDAKRTPSEMGMLTEFFRRMPEAKRSLHPTHSIAAIGPLAEELTATHQLAPTPSGKGTPFEMMARRKTAIVGFGVEYFRCLTQVHTAEDLVGDAFPVNFQKEQAPVNIVDATGKKSVYNLTVLKTANNANLSVLRPLLSRADLQEWRFRGTPMFVTYADKVTDCLVEAARKGVTIYGCDKP